MSSGEPRCEICGGTGIVRQPTAYEDESGNVQHTVRRIACWGCDYGKRHTLSQLEMLNMLRNQIIRNPERSNPNGE